MAVKAFSKKNGYYLGKLDKCVFLVSDTAIKLVITDDGAIVNYISEAPLMVNASDVQLEETETLDDRYAFSHQVSFSVNGYADYNFFLNKLFYVLVRDLDTNTLWLVNPFFPCKVTYNYTLDTLMSETRFVMSTVSNHPLLKVVGFNDMATVNPCKYTLENAVKLSLNESNYSMKTNNGVGYTNDGFKTIHTMDKTLNYQESFDGDELTVTVGFSVILDTSQNDWHISLIEFFNNKYAAVVETNMGSKIMVGFGKGLQPSYQIVGSSEQGTPNAISVTMSEQADGADANGRYADASGGGGIVPVTSKTFIYTSDYDGYECVDNGVAMYLLQKEVDALGNETGRFRCKSGYQNQFPDLNIVGTFNDVVTFSTSLCSVFAPTTGGTLPSVISLSESGECKNYTFSSSCDWSISISTGQGILKVTPMSGFAGVLYPITVCIGQTRWVESGYTCDGYDKYVLEIEQESFDSGTTWTATGNERKGSLIEADSEDCGYEPPVETIFEVLDNPITAVATSSTIVRVVSEDVSGNPIPFTIVSISSHLSANVITSDSTIEVIEKPDKNYKVGSIVIYQSGTNKNVTINVEGYYFSDWSDDSSSYDYFYADFSNSTIGSEVFVVPISTFGSASTTVEFDVASYDGGGFFEAIYDSTGSWIDPPPSSGVYPAVKLIGTSNLTGEGSVTLRQRGSGKVCSFKVIKNF
jgi:hypothetical protein